MVKSHKIRFYYGIFLAVLAVIVGVSFIIAVSQVYYGGLAENPDYPFEIERIREHIVLPFALLLCFVAAVIAGIVLSIVFPIAENKATYKDNGNTLALLKKRLPTEGGEEYAAAIHSMKKFEKARTGIWYGTLGVLLVATVAILIYVFNVTHYHTDALKADILNLVKNVLSWTVAGLAVGIAAAIADEILLKREITAIKTAIVTGDKGAIPERKEITKKAATVVAIVAGIVLGVAIAAYALSPLILHSVFSLSQTYIYVIVLTVAEFIAVGFAVYNSVKSQISDKVNKVLLLITRIAVAVIAITFIIVGVTNGGANDVLIKAINICTECIGLG
ncbi:MAG: hypothetical protein J1G02_05860 [Clostridiales bacterium]|nr:hypothetical protein [Clostridiales bacterium]